ncbi:type I restriction-modification system subunit M [Beggiatoa leptomitoformis]|uniref:site-specific DNA-methyltransferase (adenine-specific) n=1 Tax=Beggiatoa leptomitoformis TaxID=288004 RepID=A0A2N9YIQ9_9GAMM|nr:class I SAM-dependent DNA methyltransferase [Beggiatoa leptomitoformis]ALG67482.1 N-6 DNA methylase [Beggiatoa leptomitoformis]AUI70299.1 N-6 DNA methylase [Beggiatoa leptomitoformis]
MPTDLNEIEKKLWATADQMWANTGLRPNEYAAPVLGMIFLRYAEKRFNDAHQQLETTIVSARRGISKESYQRLGVIYLTETARFSHLLNLPEGENIGKALDEAMLSIEAENDELAGALPHNYQRIPNTVLIEMLKLLSPLNIDGDAFGRIYEYFMGSFAMKTMQKGGEFYTPASLVRLIVEIIEPYHGRIFDPACGSGGMFVHSANFVRNHQKNPTNELSIFGVEKVAETLRMAKLNLAIHGLSGDIREANTYYDDPHDSLGRFDFVMANPPFNQSGVDRERVKNSRFGFGVPTTDNANYLWIQLFATTLNETGRAGFVMANSASDARGSELEIRKTLINSGVVDVMVATSSNMFYTVTLPSTLWFFDKGKVKTARKDSVLFIDARHIFRQIDRAHRDFTDAQIEYLANIVRLYRGEAVETVAGSEALLLEQFPTREYQDVAGLCKVATVAEIEAQGWSLNAGRYVGVAERVADEFDFKERLEELNEELEVLNAEARELEGKIALNIAGLLG